MPTLTSRPGATATRTTSPGRLLAPARRTVPFIGRTAELAALLDWCTGPEAVAVWLVSGPRGIGKTRLAREAAHAMAQAGWTCLEVPDGAEPAALAAVPDGTPALRVVDDAETRGPALAELLRTAAQDRNGALRILLVARGAGQWFNRLTATDLAVRALLEPARAGPDLAREVFPGQVDARLVAAFVEPYARALGTAVPEVAVASIPGGARILDLHAAALCAVMRTQVAARNPDRFTGALALSLMNVARRLLELGRGAEALPAAEESLAIRRRLAAADPDEHASGLGDSLEVVGSVLTDLGRGAESLKYLEDAVRVRRRTAEENPGRYLADLAHSLQALGTQLSDLGRRDEGLGLQQDALDAEREATRTWRELAGTAPHRYGPGLARSLTNLSSIFSALRLGDEAVEPAHEAVTLLRGPAAENPATYRARLVEALWALAPALHDQERFEEARQVRGEVEELSREACPEIARLC